MLATDVRHLEPGIVTAPSAALSAALTAALTAAIALGTAAGPCPAAAPGGMPAPSPEVVLVRSTETRAIACDEPGITTVVFKGRVSSLDPAMTATFHFRFADLPDRYTVMTGARGEFEVRVSRAELGIVDLCDLPTSGTRNAAFRDSQLAIEYDLFFER